MISDLVEDSNESWDAEIPDKEMLTLPLAMMKINQAVFFSFSAQDLLSDL